MDWCDGGTVGFVKPGELEGADKKAYGIVHTPAGACRTIGGAMNGHPSDPTWTNCHMDLGVGERQVETTTIQRLFAAAGCEGDVPAATAASQVAEVNAGRMTLGQVSDFWAARASDLNDATCDNATKRQHHEDAQMAEEHKTFGQNVRYNYTVTGRDIKYGIVSQIRTCDSDQTVLPVPLGGSEITYDECADVCAATDDCQFFSVQNNECVQELTQSIDCPEGISRAGASDFGFLALERSGFDHTSSAMNYSANSVATGDLSCSSVTTADIEDGTVSSSCASFLKQHYDFTTEPEVKSMRLCCTASSAA